MSAAANPHPGTVPAAPELARAAGAGILALLVAAAPALPAAGTLALCRRWRESRGSERIRLGNSIGASHYLTKQHRLEESPETNPVPLYAEADLQRVCRWP